MGKTTVAQIAEMREKLQRAAERDRIEFAALVLLGDVGESLKDIRVCLQELECLAPVRVFLPGNHDLFDTERIGSSLSRYQDHLPRLARECGYLWAEEGPILVPDSEVALVLTPAWPKPDYVPPGVQGTLRELRAARREELPDGKWIHDIDDEEFSDAQLRRFIGNLAAVPQDIKRVIVGSHVPLFPSLLPVGDKPDPLDAFYCSPRFGEAVINANRTRGCTRVTDAICGHTHVGTNLDVEWSSEHPPIHATVIESGYGRPGYVLVHL